MCIRNKNRTFKANFHKLLIYMSSLLFLNDFEGIGKRISTGWRAIEKKKKKK